LPSITAEDVVKLFEADVKARKRLAEPLVSDPDVRLAMISAVLRDVATKSDMEALRKELKSDVEALRRDVSELRERISKLEGTFTQLVDGIDDLDKRTGALDKRIDSFDKRIDYTTKVSWALTISVPGYSRSSSHLNVLAHSLRLTVRSSKTKLLLRHPKQLLIFSEVSEKSNKSGVPELKAKSRSTRRCDKSGRSEVRKRRRA
jgi:septal ring factor EnvC (AmiA/AmiB activator)